jgi:hypothetical protein
MIYTQEQIDETFNRLPEEVQDFILSEEVSETLQVIEQGYGIPESKSDDFALNVMALLVGVGNTDEFVQDLQAGYNLRQDIANQVLYDVYAALIEPTHYLFNRAVGTTPTSSEPTLKNPTPASSSSFALSAPATPSTLHDEHPGSSAIRDYILTGVENPERINSVTPPSRPTPPMPRPITPPAPRPVTPPQPAPSMTAPISRPQPQSWTNVPNQNQTNNNWAQPAQNQVPAPRPTPPAPTSRPISAPAPAPAQPSPRPTPPIGSRPLDSYLNTAPKKPEAPHNLPMMPEHHEISVPNYSPAQPKPPVTAPPRPMTPPQNSGNSILDRKLTSSTSIPKDEYKVDSEHGKQRDDSEFPGHDPYRESPAP